MEYIPLVGADANGTVVVTLDKMKRHWALVIMEETSHIGNWAHQFIEQLVGADSYCVFDDDYEHDKVVEKYVQALDNTTLGLIFRGIYEGLDGFCFDISDLSVDELYFELRWRLMAKAILNRLEWFDTRQNFLAMDGTRWITLHPNGPNSEGRHVLIDEETMEIIAGLGILNGKTLDEISSKSKSNSNNSSASSKKTKKKRTLKLPASKVKVNLGYIDRESLFSPEEELYAAILMSDVKEVESPSDGDDQTKKAKTNEIIARQISLISKARGSLGSWSSAIGVLFKDKQKQDQFLKLERTVYRYLGLMNQEANTELIYKDDERKKIRAFIDYYYKECRDWSEAETPETINKVMAFEKKVMTFCGGGSRSFALQNESVCDLRATSFLAFQGKSAATFINKWTAEADECYSTKAKLANNDRIPHHIQVYVKAKFWLHNMDHYFGVKDKLMEHELEELKRLRTECLALCEQTKAILLARNNALTEKEAIFKEATRAYHLSEEANAKFAFKPKKLAGVIPGDDMPFDQADNHAPNPHYNAPIFEKLEGFVKPVRPYRVNCQACSVTFILRTRGFDVEAQPFLDVEGNGCRELASRSASIWRQKDTKASPVPMRHDSLLNLNNVIKPGEYHMLAYRFNEENGHIVIAGCDNGGIFVYDPQVGKKLSLSAFNEENGGVNTITTFRVDDCELDVRIVNRVLTKANTGIHTALKQPVRHKTYTGDSAMTWDKEYFQRRLKEAAGGEVAYKGMLDGCYVFWLYHKEDIGCLVGPPIYAFCDPNDPEIVKIDQGGHIYTRLYKKYKGKPPQD